VYGSIYETEFKICFVAKIGYTCVDCGFLSACVGRIKKQTNVLQVLQETQICSSYRKCMTMINVINNDML
jgi:hypothetical protein